MSEQYDKTWELDGIRPIEQSELEVADTFEADGVRPIAESPDFLIQNEPNSTPQERPLDSNKLNADRVLEVDTFEADGTRPIMANKYEVVDTLNLDGDRPITSQ